MYRSGDNGQTWVPVNNGLNNTLIKSVAFSTTGTLLAGTSDGFNNGIYRSSDYGDNWTPVNDGLRGVRVWKMATTSDGIILAGSYSSGMFRSVDGGATWESVNTGLTGFSASYRIRALTISPDDVIYMGTYGSGVFKSEDKGLHWTQMINGLSFTYIMGLGSGPAGLIYAGTDAHGVFKSTNYGDSWGSTGTEIGNTNIYGLMVRSADTVLAGAYGNGLWRSVDAGVSWQKVGGGDLPTIDVYDMVTDSNGDIFVATADTGICRSTDGGTNWEIINQGLVSDYISTLAVNRLDHVFAGGGGRVYISENNGEEWSNIPEGTLDISANTLTINPLGDLFAGTPNGIYKSVRSTTQVSVHFAVKMLYASNFNPSTDAVVVRGNFNNWGSATSDVKLDPVSSDPDVMFTGSYNTFFPDTLADLITADTLRYKFVFRHTGEDYWEATIAPRSLSWDHLSDLDLPAVWFNEPVKNLQDSTALADLYHNTAGDGWTNHNNWLTDRPFSQWYGISSDPQGRVILADLFYNNLSGTIPSSIGDLSQLRSLNIGDNNLSGTIPAEINLLDSLVTLNLSLNDLSGTIPALTNQPNLTVLDLSSNGLTGSIPDNIGDFKNLGHLLLTSNQLSGEIPVSVGSLPNLVYLMLNANQLQGALPAETGNLTNLEYLFVNQNNLSGSIPSEIGNLSKLYTLSLNNNSFSGNVPEQIGNLTGLRYLFFYDNELTGGLPATLSDLENLIFFDCSFNQLSNPIPPGIFQLPKLTYFNCSNNQFSGNVGSTFNHTPMNQLDLSNNRLSGEIPPAITNYDSLQFLFLQNNQFSGLPDLTSLTKLNHLYTELNRFTFEDLEPNIGIEYFTYYTQDSVGIAYDTTIAQSSDLSISVTVGGSNNRYQWYQNGGAVNGATANVYDITSAGVSDQGTYICTITNTVATDLTLYSRPIMVVVAGVVPTITLLKAPASGTTGLPVNPTLIWNTTAGAETYQLQICKNDTFALPLVEVRTGLTSTAIQINGLTGNTVYYWRVRAVNSIGNGEWSKVWNFTTEASSAPAPPLLSAPNNNALNVSVFPTLQWSATAGTYQVQLDDETLFDSPLVDVDTVTQKQFRLRDQGLRFNQQYYWRLKVTYTGYTSDWSEIRGFTTESYPVDIQLQNITTFPTKLGPGDFVSSDYRIFGIPGNGNIPLGDLLGGCFRHKLAGILG